MKKINNTFTAIILIILISVFSTESRELFQFGDVGNIRLKSIPIDYSIFKSDQPDKVRLEIYYQIYNYFLSFKEENNQYIANYEVELTILDKKKNEVVLDKIPKTIIVNSIDKTKSLADFRTLQMNFDLDPGKYKIIVTLRDKHSRKVNTKDLKVNLKKYDKKSPKFSEIEFSQAFGEIQSETSPFNKGNIAVVPSVTHIYGGLNRENHLLFYVEIYPGKKDVKEAVMITILRDHKYGKMIYRDSVTVPIEYPRSMQLRDIVIDDFRPGDYELEIELRSNRKKKFDSKHKAFNIQMTPEMFIKHDYDVVLKQLSFIANDGEIDEMKKIEDLKLRIQAFKEFWELRDPTPGTSDNEYKTEFYRRVRHATSRYSYLRRDGWKTDRGRTYIMYGEPDQLEDFPLSPNRRPYQEWHYYRDGRYRKFVFIDENEDGEYRLAYPYDGFNMRPDF